MRLASRRYFETPTTRLRGERFVKIVKRKKLRSNVRDVKEGRTLGRD